jgi:hypothetical protein
VTQTKTPATEKWLLNEIARIKGDQAKLDAQKTLLTEQLHHIEALRKEKTRMLQALKATLNVVSKGATVELDRVVRAHRDIGGRGVLADWLKEHLQQVSPQSLDAPTLMDRFCASVHMRFWTDAEREEYFNNTFRSQLRRLKRQGYLEQVDVYVAGRCRSQWRWRSATSSLDELREIANKVDEQEAPWP